MGRWVPLTVVFFSFLLKAGIVGSTASPNAIVSALRAGFAAMQQGQLHEALDSFATVAKSIETDDAAVEGMPQNIKLKVRYHQSQMRRKTHQSSTSYQ